MFSGCAGTSASCRFYQTDGQAPGNTAQDSRLFQVCLSPRFPVVTLNKALPSEHLFPLCKIRLNREIHEVPPPLLYCQKSFPFLTF